VTPVHVKAFDHLVLNVADVERSVDFYTGLLGLEPVRLAEWRSGKVPFPSVRVTPETIIDLVSRSRGESNVDHICLTVEPLDWDEVIRSGSLRRARGPHGPLRRTGHRHIGLRPGPGRQHRGAALVPTGRCGVTEPRFRSGYSSTGPEPSGEAQSAIGRYTRLPAAANSFDFWAMPSSISPRAPPCSRRMSWEIFIEQNFGPHIEQK
jgi:catechol 2,3-dioxygenase-like lactoylglutathione lyase family enzyme